MIAIIDYGAGNLHSVQKAVEFVGGQAEVTSDAQTILNAEKAILPGVGAFKKGMEGLSARRLIRVIASFAASGKPLLGICLGMQLLFEESDEMGRHRGLGLLPGRVCALNGAELKIPQIGWNTFRVRRASPLVAGLPDKNYAYFNHGYYCQPADEVHILAVTEYGLPFASLVRADNLYGVQFHPEKSQRVGLRILQNFVELL